VQVGRAHVDRVDQHLLQEAHDRRVFDLGGDVAALGLRGVFFGDVELEVAVWPSTRALVGAGALRSTILASLSYSTITHSG
jgi:hypothetical protein